MKPAAPLTGGLTSGLTRGLAWGLLAAAIWTAYSVLARLGIKSGLTPLDMTLLRFAPGALLMLPFVLRWGLADLAGLGWRRGLALALLSGPAFSLLMMSGFVYAPLAHGAVIAPACQMLASIGFGRWLAGAGITRETGIGAAFVLMGLAFMGSDALLQGGAAVGAAGGAGAPAAGELNRAGPVWLGDLLFAAAGACWGLFGALSRRWQTDPLRLTGVAVVVSFALFAPVYALVANPQGLLAAPPGFVLMQAVAHGIGAGLVAMLAYNRAVALLGPGRAAFFGAMVPGAASLLAIPVLGEVPTGLQVAGLLTVVMGLLTAFGALRLLRRRQRGGDTQRAPVNRR